MSAWDDFKASGLYKGDIEITDTLTNYDSVNTWSGIEATAAFPLADPNDLASALIILNPGDYRSNEYLHLLGGKYELEMAGFIDYPWQVQYSDLDNPNAVRTRVHCVPRQGHLPHPMLRRRIHAPQLYRIRRHHRVP